MKPFIVRVFKGKRVHMFIQWAQDAEQAKTEARQTWFPAPENITDIETEEILQGVNKLLGLKISEDERIFTVFCRNCTEFYRKSMPESEFLEILDQNPGWSVPEIECQGCIDFGKTAVDPAYPNYSGYYENVSDEDD